MTHQDPIAPTVVQHGAFDATQAAPSLAGPPLAAPSPAAPSPAGPSRAAPSQAFLPPTSAARTTVLPHVDGDGVALQLSLESRSRYEPTKLLGAGGMGEVVLVKDHDIERKVALKRLLPELTDAATLARFVDEIRCVGRLEHPNIVPIHDVGVDELGRYFFVMKYVEGETLEHIIEKLAAKDPVYTYKYSFEVRAEIFLGLLNALQYAHEQGIVHRDVKPANIMVGRYGEVVLMDWGVSKPIAAPRDAARGADGAIRDGGDGGTGERARMYATRVGSLIGTPAYMAPEQARGDVDKIDARSDLYSAMVVLHELLGLRHYMTGKETMEALLAGIIAEQPKLLAMDYPAGAPPAEWVHLLSKGLSKDPDKRFQSAGELIEAVHAILEGRIKVQCPVTATKRTYRELGRLVDRAPWMGLIVLTTLVAAVVFSGVQLVRMAL